MFQNYFQIPMHKCTIKLWPGQAQFMTIYDLTKCDLDRRPSATNVSNCTSTPQGEQLGLDNKSLPLHGPFYSAGPTIMVRTIMLRGHMQSNQQFKEWGIQTWQLFILTVFQENKHRQRLLILDYIYTVDSLYLEVEGTL